MHKRGRPPGEEEIKDFHIHMRLRVKSDADIIKFFELIPPGFRVTRLKNALRAGGIEKMTGESIEVEDDSFADDLESLTF
jgi:hypothetical protein